MVLKIAWRNIWRSRTRSIVVILSVVAGVWALCFILSFSNGMMSTYITNAIRDQWSHIQMHNPQFPEDKDAKFYLENASAILANIRQRPEVAAATSRVIASGMVSSPRAARGVQIIGVSPEPEAMVTHLDTKVKEGEYFQPDKRNEILISRRMAEKLKVKLRSRIVLTFQNLDKEITSAAFRVAGLFESGNLIYDEAVVFVTGATLKKNLVPEISASDSLAASPLTDFTHEIAVFLKDSKNVVEVKKQLAAAYPNALVQDYWELSPDIELYETQIDSSNNIIIVIFMLALIFGIINTMLMAVLERYRELGMLMAIGMNKTKIFMMVVLETLMLGLVAAPIGLGLSYLTVHALQDTGIDLSAFSKGLERFGMETTIFPEMDMKLYTQIAVAVLITALIASIWPARKAIRLNPAEALQKL